MEMTKEQVKILKDLPTDRDLFTMGRQSGGKTLRMLWEKWEEIKKQWKKE